MHILSPFLHFEISIHCDISLVYTMRRCGKMYHHEHEPHKINNARVLYNVTVKKHHRKTC